MYDEDETTIADQEIELVEETQEAVSDDEAREHIHVEWAGFI